MDKRWTRMNLRSALESRPAISFTQRSRRRFSRGSGGDGDVVGTGRHGEYRVVDSSRTREKIEREKKKRESKQRSE